jgi:hypothetical protein
MIPSLLLALPYFTISVKSVQLHKRVEICPGATMFILHGHHASWVKKKRLLCKIGKHDFYGDKK